MLCICEAGIPRSLKYLNVPITLVCNYVLSYGSHLNLTSLRLRLTRLPTWKY